MYLFCFPFSPLPKDVYLSNSAWISIGSVCHKPDQCQCVRLKATTLYKFIDRCLTKIQRHKTCTSSSPNKEYRQATSVLHASTNDASHVPSSYPLAIPDLPSSNRLGSMGPALGSSPLYERECRNCTAALSSSLANARSFASRRVSADECDVLFCLFPVSVAI